MTHSVLTSRIVTSPKSSSRNGAVIDTVLIHHVAGTNGEATLKMMADPNAREVSANYVITNEGEIVNVVDERFRAWTSGSKYDGGKGAAWDRRSITIEIENETGAPGWKISVAALRAMAALLNDLRSRYRIVNILGHRDLWLRFRASYATYCPGPETVAQVVSLASTNPTIPPVVSPPPAPLPAPVRTDAFYAYGLTKASMLAAQDALRIAGLYSGIVDGIFGALSVRAMQTYLKNVGALSANYVVDGLPDPIYARGLQTMLRAHGYAGDIDGIFGPFTNAALRRWAKWIIGGKPKPTPPSPAPLKWKWVHPSRSIAIRIQRALKARGRYNGAIDGIFGPLTIKGIQITIGRGNGYTGAVDGIPGPLTCRGIQTYAKMYGGYAWVVNGILGPFSWLGFVRGLEKGL